MSAVDAAAAYPFTPGARAAHGTSSILTATAVAIGAGACYALSPLTIPLGLLLGALIWWGCHDLRGRERRWMATLLVGSVAVRIAGIAVIAAIADPRRGTFQTVYGDAQYALERSMWLRNALLGTPMSLLDTAEAFHTYARSIYYYPLAWLQLVFGPAPYALHLTSVIGCFAAAIALHRLVRPGFGRVVAFAGLTLVLCLPTLLLWSMAPLKESMYFSLSSLAVVATARLIRARGWTEAAVALVGVGLALTVAGQLRTGGLAMAFGGLILGLAITAIVSHRGLVIAALVGVPVVAPFLIRQPVVADAIVHPLRQMAATHIGFINSPGPTYRLLDDEGFYTVRRPVEDLTLAEAIPFVGRGLREFVLMPRPWAPSSRNEVAMVPQQLIWYALVLFNVPGVIAGLRRDALVTALLFGTAVAGALAIAPASGNVGTLIRHRDMIVPFMVWIGVLGAVATMNQCADLVRKEGK